MNILVVDDDTALLRALEVLLRERGHDATCVDSAEDAVVLVAENFYDFVLVDYHMPKKSGAWFMKNAQIPSRTKTLLVTGNIDRDIINDMFALGASGYLIKPFDQEELFQHLEFHTR